MQKWSIERRRQRGKGIEKIFKETVSENSQIWFKKKNINLHIQETQQTQNGITAKQFTARHIIVKILKAKGKEKISKAKRVGKSTHHIQ